MLGFNDFYFKIYDVNRHRFEVPQGGLFPSDPMNNFSFPISVSAITIEYSTHPFDFKIIRKENMAILFSTYDKTIIFSEHYLQIGTEIDSQHLYGFGERFESSFRKKDGKWTMWNRDKGKRIDAG